MVKEILQLQKELGVKNEYGFSCGNCECSPCECELQDAGLNLKLKPGSITRKCTGLMKFILK